MRVLRRAGGREELIAEDVDGVKVVPKRKKKEKQSLETDVVFDCPFCGESEKLWAMGPWQKPKYMHKCGRTKLTIMGLAEEARDYFERRLAAQGLDIDETRQHIKDMMREAFAPKDGEKKPAKKKQSAKKPTETEEVVPIEEDELSKVVEEMWVEYGR